MLSVSELKKVPLQEEQDGERRKRKRWKKKKKKEERKSALMNEIRWSVFTGSKCVLQSAFFSFFRAPVTPANTCSNKHFHRQTGG